MDARKYFGWICMQAFLVSSLSLSLSPCPFRNAFADCSNEVLALLELNVEVNLADSQGETALSHACVDTGNS